MFLFRANQISQNTVQFVYGQGIPVSGLQPFSDTFAPVNWQNPNVEFSYEREQQVLQGQIEECLGQVDFTLQSQINKRQPRTLGEVQLQQQSMQTVFSLDADMFRESFADLINWIWELDCQYGDEEKVFSYLGQQGYENIKLTREEIQGKYKIIVRGNDQNTNPQNKLQKAQFVLQDVYQALTMGMASPESVMAARKRAYQTLDIDGYEEFLQPPQPQQPAPTIKLKGADLTDAEQAQILAKQGIQPDMQGRALKKQDEHEETEFDQMAQVAGMVSSGE
jgi:hypothetical protein